MKSLLLRVIQKSRRLVGHQNSCFIISAPRSGSTWLQTALNSHPEVFCTEHRFFGDFCEIWPDNETSASPRITLDRYVDLVSHFYQWEAIGLTRTEFRAQITHELINTFHTFARKKTGKSVIADKITPYLGSSSVVATAINRKFKTAKLIFLVRDGRDVLTSGVFDWMRRSDSQTTRYKYFVEGDTTLDLERFFSRKDIETWCAYWKEAFSTLKQLHTDSLVIRYEDMKSDHASELRKIFTYLNIDCDAKIIEDCVEMSSFKKMSKGRKPDEIPALSKVRKGIVGDWKNFFTKQDAKDFWQLGRNELIDWGYEANDAWIETCPEKPKLDNAS